MANSLNTITVDGVVYDADSYARSHSTDTTKEQNALNKDAFLQLLVTQMKYQDPLDPMDNSQYLSQLAQFSALEQMTNVSDGLEEVSKLVSNIDTSVLVGQLSSMIGQDVRWSEDGVNSHEGKVTGVSISDGSPTVIAESNGITYQVAIGDITRVGQGASN